MQGMTFFDSDILGADTTQIESLSKALLDGNVPGTNESGLSSLSDTALWNADPWNVWLIVACTISGMIILPQILHIAPIVWNCLWRTKGSYNIYISVPLWRERNLVALLCVVPFCLMVSRSHIFRLQAMEGMSDGMTTLLTIGICIGWLLVRLAMARLLAPRISSEEWKIAVSNPRNFFVMATMAMLVVTAIEMLAGWGLDVTARLSLLIIGLLYFMLLLRNLEILSRKYHHFKAFLYLCGLEGLTSALLITCILIF